jgi:hypothetical protein
LNFHIMSLILAGHHCFGIVWVLHGIGVVAVIWGLLILSSYLGWLYDISGWFMMMLGDVFDSDCHSIPSLVPISLGFLRRFSFPSIPLFPTIYHPSFASIYPIG